MKYQDYKGLNQISLRELSRLVADDRELRFFIIKNMIMYAESFVKTLSQCLLIANRNNRIKLCDAFMEHILDYLPEKWPQREKEK